MSYFAEKWIGNRIVSYPEKYDTMQQAIFDLTKDFKLGHTIIIYAEYTDGHIEPMAKIVKGQMQSIGGRWNGYNQDLQGRYKQRNVMDDTLPIVGGRTISEQ